MIKKYFLLISLIVIYIGNICAMEPKKITDRWVWPSSEERYQKLRYTPTHHLPSKWQFLKIWWQTPTEFQQLIKQEEQLNKNIDQAIVKIINEEYCQTYKTLGMGILGGIAVIGTMIFYGKQIMAYGTQYEQLPKIGFLTGLVIADEIKHDMNNRLEILNQKKEDAINQKDLFMQNNSDFLEQKKQRAMYPLVD